MITQTQIERKPTTAALTTAYTYDTAGNLTKTVAPGSKTTDYTVNAAGQLIEVTDPNRNKSTFAYDALGRPAKVTDALGNATEAAYDLAGRQTTAKDLDASGAVVRTIGFGYDPAGNPISRTSGEGHTTRREFDALGRATKLIEPVTTDKSITTTFGYDATGARTRLTDGRGNATWTTYNSLGLVESVTEPATTAHPDAADRTWTNLYDAAGNTTTTLQPGGVRIDRTFDHLNRMVKQTGTGAAVDTPERTVTYDTTDRPTAIGDYGLEYNDRGLLTKLTKAGTQVAAYAYDALGNPIQRVDPTGTAAYTWDDGSRLKTATDPVTGSTFAYGYDKADRLTSLTSTGSVATSQSYGYDAVDRLTSHTLKNSGGTELSKIGYGWDKDDNLTTKTTSGTAGAGTHAYGYDHAGRLTSWTGPDGKTVDYAWDDAGNRTKAGTETFVYDERNRLTSGAGTDYTYTPRGTLATETTNGTTKNLVFNAFDQLITDGETSYGYDALGRMTSRVKADAQQRFVYSGLSNDIAAVTDGAGTVHATYGRDPFGGLLSLKEGTDPALGVMSDRHGDVVATFSGTAVVDSSAYDPFGKVTHSSGTKRSLGYQGEYTDPDTGKVNMHARWYQPGTGGFASRDDWTLEPSPSIQGNRYTYGNGSPLIHTDPSGHAPPPGWCGIFASDWWHPDCMEHVQDDTCRNANGKAVTCPPDPVKYFPKGNPPCETPQDPSCPKKPTKPKTPPGSATRTTHKAPTGGAPTPNPCRNSNNYRRPNPTDNPAPKPPKSKPYVPGFDPKSPSFINDPISVTEDPGPSQEEIDRQCQTGPCNGSYTGHVGTPIGGPVSSGGGGGGGGGGGITCYAIDPDSCPEKPGGDDPPPSSIGEICADILICDLTIGDAVNCVTNPSLWDCIMAGAGVVPIGKIGKIGKLIDKAGDAGKACKRSSFVPGTLVLMADGTRKPIEDVEVGDQVIATDPETGQTGPRTVTALIESEGTKTLVQITMGAHDDGNDLIATDNHPFWVPVLREWVPAGQLQPGMWLRTSAGTHVQITAIKTWTTGQRVHNLTVDGPHTYHVLAGSQAILAHNAPPSPGPDGIVYLRTDLITGEEYVGQAKSPERYQKRQKEHAKKHPNSLFTFEVLGRAKPGVDLDVLEESWIRAGGGSRKDPGSALSNDRRQMNDKRYKNAGGDVC
ncbi:RHS repeat-associated core domain-containing protein [Planomonospora sp. ID82291]|uniref:RHS repeat-associated core domain-containing protein n=1 Tax=Planomonospora sp. ID82291 TaxID=2738136 RepID=UPI002104B70F|nr:RHS repeat-associated core domain-containing protein [Planomonospora sp. ID82291]